MDTTRSLIALALMLCACSNSDGGNDDPEQASVYVGEDLDGGRDPFGTESAASMATGERPADASAATCSNFSLTVVGPFIQLIGEEATLTGHAQDDANHNFVLSWSASDGELSERTGPTTKHTCSEAGVSTVSLTASMASVCTSAIAHVVTCLMP